MARSKQFIEEDVLEKAVAQFWDKGYYGTSIQDLVANLGLSRSSIYDTYTDKRQLFLTSLAHYSEQSTALITDKILNSDNLLKTIEELLLGTPNCPQDGTVSKQPKGCFVVNTITELAAHDQEVTQIAQNSINAVVQTLTAALVQGQQNGTINKNHKPEALARFLHNNFTGIRVAEQAGASPEALQETTAVVLGVLKP